MTRAVLLVAMTITAVTSTAAAQDLDTVRNDQIDRLKNYVLDAIMPSGLVRDSLVLNGTSFHPATPDAAGFALVSLSAFDHLDKLPNAEQHVIDILEAYTGNKPGVVPERSLNGHYIHFMDVNNGSDPPGWDDSYTPIGTALLVAGAQFARNHFADNSTIAALTDELTNSVDFNAAIHPNLNGRIYLDVGKQGTGVGGTVGIWNEFMLVESLALRQSNNDRAVAVRHRWLNTENLPTRSLNGIPTLTDNPSRYAPAFWVQQMHFFNGDFRHSAEFETFFDNQQQADQLYSSTILGEAFRYGLTAGLVPPPTTYHADRIGDHPFTVFSPEAVAAWGDLDTLLQFYAEQFPTTDPRYKYGLLRVSAEQPTWVPPDTGLVDHLFLLFGLVESIDPDFFADRVLAPLVAGDYDFNGVVDAADYTTWRDTLGSTGDLRADGNLNGVVDNGDYNIWFANVNAATTGHGAATSLGVPEPGGLAVAVWLCLLAGFRGERRRDAAGRLR